MKYRITWGQDTPAYAEQMVDLPGGLTPEQVVESVRTMADKVGDLIFDPSCDWTGLRVVDITDEAGAHVAGEIPIEPSGEDLGLVTRNVLSGAVKPRAVIHEAERQGIAVKPEIRRLLDPESALPVPEFDPFTLYVEAYACDEYGDSPVAARLDITPQMLRSMVRKAAILLHGDMRLGYADASDDTWIGADDLRMRGTDLVISPSRYGENFGLDFWIQGHPKHANYNCESRMIDLEELIAQATGTRLDDPKDKGVGRANPWFWADKGTLVYAGDPGSVVDLFDQIMEAVEADGEAEDAQP